MKLRLEVDQVRRNVFTTEGWLKARKKKADLKCNNCKRLYQDLPGLIALVRVRSSTNKHICDECAKAYIATGLRDIDAEIQVAKAREIPKPEPKVYHDIAYRLRLNDDQIRKLGRVLSENGFKYSATKEERFW